MSKLSLVIMRGVTCSGKSNHALTTFPDSTIVSSDAIRLLLTNDMSEQRINEHVFYLIHDILKTRMQFFANTVVDATHLRMSDINKYLEISKDYRITPCVISIKPPSIDQLMKNRDRRVSNGGLYIPDEVFIKHIKRYNDNTQNFINAHNDGIINFSEIELSY